MASVSQHIDRGERIAGDLAHRAKRSLIGTPAAFALIWARTSFMHDHPTAALLFGLAFGFAVIGRAILLWRRKQWFSGRIELWKNLFVLSLLVSASAWGALSAFAFSVYSLQHPTLMIVLFAVNAIAGFSFPLVLERQTVALVHSGLYLIPAILVLVLRDGFSPPATGLIFYATYLTIQARSFTREYQAALDNTILLARLAHHDPLTGLANRLSLENAMKSLLPNSGQSPRPACLFYIDLDGFKQVNDVYSHQIGDLLLVEIAQRLNNAIESPSAVVCRLGGDEFVIFAPDIHEASEAQAIAHRLLDAIQEPAVLDGISLQPAASVGISFTSPTRAADLEEVLRSADQAMYLAKAVEGCAFRVHEPTQTTTLSPV